jgi:hypothetical protein
MTYKIVNNPSLIPSSGDKPTFKVTPEGELVISFGEADHPYDAGVTIRKTKAGRPGSGSKVEERWLPIERTDAVHLLKHIGCTVNAVWAVGDRVAVVMP